MIELIRTLVTTVAQVIPRIGTMRTDKKKRELGASLFILYVRLNEIMVCADAIIDGLEVYIERMRRHMAHDDDAYALTGGKWIAQKVRHQITNFERLSELLDERGTLLQIIDAESYNRLIPLLDRKFGALTELLHILRMGSLPLYLSEADLEALIGTGADQSALHRVIIDLEPRWREEALSTTTEWGPEVYARVCHYLQVREPRNQLAQIGASLAGIREALEEYFSIADVLLEVGDKRLESRYW